MKLFRVAAAFVILILPASGSAQTRLLKHLIVDPTTYAPTAMAYASMHMDWKTSQPLFKAGWLERNPDFTVSGRQHDTPISYGAGRTKNVFLVLQVTGCRRIVNRVKPTIVAQPMTTIV
jgi:hypothetical protein